MIETPSLPRATTESAPLVVRFRPLYDMTPDEFFEFCAQNPDLVVELTAEGEVVFMSPSGSATANRNARVVVALWQWAEKNGEGVVFDSSAGFTLPNKAVRAPDVSWVRKERMADLTKKQKERFIPLSPDFVVEIASPTDRPSYLQAKMEEYVANGTRLGWLLLPEARSVYVYKPGEPQLHSNVDSISGDPTLPGFTLDLRPIWEPDI